MQIYGNDGLSPLAYMLVTRTTVGTIENFSLCIRFDDKHMSTDNRHATAVTLFLLGIKPFRESAQHLEEWEAKNL